MWTVMLEPLLISDFFFFLLEFTLMNHIREQRCSWLLFSYVVNDPVEFKFLI